MKTFIILTLALLTTLASVYVIQKSVSKLPTTTEVTVMRDITDTLVSEPNLDDIKVIYNLESSPWNGAVFRFVDITDVTYNHTYEKRIMPENEWMGNEFDRSKKVKEFYKDIAQILDTTLPKTKGKKKSSIYLPIVTELNRLKESTSDNKTLLIYSDLTENTNTFSFYDKNNIEKLRTNDKSTEDYFLNLTPLHDLEGVRIFLIYQPKNHKSDEDFTLIATFFKTQFEKKGAIVQITANITGNGLPGEIK